MLFINQQAFNEAQKVLKTKPLIWSGKSEKHTKIPYFHDVEQNPDAKFLHICANETIYGVEYKDTQVLKMVSWWLICLQISIPSP